MSYQLYRNTSIGQTLQDSLYELIQYGQIPPQLASVILLQFDKTINAALSGRTAKKVVFHSEKLSTYRFCDNVWTFLLKNVEFREGNHEITKVQKVKIVACDAKGTGGNSATTSVNGKEASNDK